MRLTLALITIAIFTLSVEANAAPANETFVAHLSGSEEAPPVMTLAQGQAIFKIRNGGVINYQLITATQLIRVFDSYMPRENSALTTVSLGG